MEATFTEAGGASKSEFNQYMRSANALKRILESLGINRGRISRDVSPTDLHDYIATKTRRNGRGNGHARSNNRVQIIDHVEDA